MWRFIVVTFGFLGFAFFQLSGGSDYQPAEGSRQHAAAQSDRDAATPRVAQIGSTPRTIHSPDTGVTGSGAQVVLVSSGSRPAPARATIEGSGKRLHVTLNAAPAKPDTYGVTTVAANPDKIARLVAAAGAVRPDPSAAPQPDATPVAANDDRDLRTVSKSRVNMRQGPGKDFNVIARLARGERVEVVRDNGDGWVKLRVVETGRVGWMADFLLVAAK